jgi:hypothetical protein
MSSTSDALRATSDALLRDLEVLGTLEDEKRTISPGDPRLVDLAAQIEEIAKRVLSGSRREHELTQLANAQVNSGAQAAPMATIDETSRSPSEILAEWRAAERRRAAADPATAEWSEADALVDHLRDEYRQASRNPDG